MPHGALQFVAPGIRYLPLRTPTLPPATHTNCVVLGEKGDLLIVDPGSPWDDERRQLDRVLEPLLAAGARVREIFLTHHHADHVAGAAWLAARLGAPMAAHPATARLLPELAITRQVRDGETLRLGAQIFEALHTPGHASGHLCLFDPASRTLVAGDMIAGVGTIVIDPPDGRMADYFASLARLRALPPRVLLPAHGEPITDGPGRLDEYTRHRLWREGRVLAELRAGAATIDDLVPRVYADVAAASHPLAARALCAHLEKLIDVGRVRRDGATYRRSET